MSDHTDNGAVSGRTPQEATQALTQALERVSGLHEDLAEAHLDVARCYRDLGQDAEITLAALRQASVHADVPAPPEYLTPAQVADRLKVHPRTLRRMELAGEIPRSVGSGRRKRWRAEDLAG